MPKRPHLISTYTAPAVKASSNYDHTSRPTRRLRMIATEDDLQVGIDVRAVDFSSWGRSDDGHHAVRLG